MKKEGDERESYIVVEVSTSSKTFNRCITIQLQLWLNERRRIG